MEEKVCYRDVGKHSWGRLPRGNPEACGERKRERGEPSITARRAKVQKGTVTKMSELYREEPQWEGLESLG